MEASISTLSAGILLFLIMDPLGNVPLFLSLLKNVAPERRRRVLVRELLIALLALFGFLFGGSYVLKALGLGDDVAHSSIRFGLGRFNTQAEVDYVAAKVIDIVKKLRELSPLYEMVKEGIDLTKIEWQAH